MLVLLLMMLLQKSNCVRFAFNPVLLFAVGWLTISLTSSAAGVSKNADILEARGSCNVFDCAAFAIALTAAVAEVAKGHFADASKEFIGGGQAVHSYSTLPCTTETDKCRSVHASIAFLVQGQQHRLLMPVRLEWLCCDTRHEWKGYPLSKDLVRREDVS
jgi:hypothetical protein